MLTNIKIYLWSWAHKAYVTSFLLLKQSMGDKVHISLSHACARAHTHTPHISLSHDDGVGGVLVVATSTPTQPFISTASWPAIHNIPSCPRHWPRPLSPVVIIVSIALANAAPSLSPPSVVTIALSR